MAVSLKRSVEKKLHYSWCVCCGNLTPAACRREIVKTRRKVRRAGRLNKAELIEEYYAQVEEDMEEEIYAY